MLVSVNPNERIAVGRLLELLSERTPWHRSLWGVGIVLTMEELYEACIALRQGHLSDSALKRMGSSLQKRVGVHPAFSDAEKQFLRQQVQHVPRADGAAHFGIKELSERVNSDYLVRWAKAVSEGRFEVELFGRSVAAHLLDAGFSPQYLHEFIKSRLDADAPPITLPQLCEELQADAAANPSRSFEVLLAFSSVPKFESGLPEAWLRDAAVTQWLQANGFETTDVRSPIAVVLTVQARDGFGAAQAARSEADRYAARALIATGHALNLLPMLWVKGTSAPTMMRDASRGVAVKELALEHRVFSTEANQSVDAALELLAHLEGSSPPAAVAGGWGAIEGLLADPSDRASAADNLATLVTCSFPRAELTALAYHVQRIHPKRSAELRAAPTNRERSQLVAQMIVDDQLPEMPAMADKAAIARMKRLLNQPGQILNTIRDAVGDSFHRLYRQRNLILHGARLDSVALTPSLRTVAKLAGAGMDRITHGHYEQGLRPLELVAKANLALALISRDTAMNCVDLLEDN